MLHPDPRGFLALVAVAMCWALAGVLHRASIPGRDSLGIATVDAEAIQRDLQARIEVSRTT